MIRKMQLRFIRAAVLAVALVLITIMAAVNIINYHNVVSNADQVLDVLADNDGTFPDISLDEEMGGREKSSADSSSSEKSASDSRTSSVAGSSQNAGSDSKSVLKDSASDHTSTSTRPQPPEAEGENQPPAPDGVLNQETPYESRYFTVTYDSKGNISTTNLERIASVDADGAKRIAAKVYSGSRTRGFIRGFRYRRTSADDGTTLLIFLDCQRSLDSFHSFLGASIGVSAAGLAAVIVLIILFSRRVVRPAQESYEKQRQFITDAGHELKTPLTTIDADISVIEMEGGESEWTEDVKSQTKRLAGLTNDLIYLSRMDENAGKLEMIDFPLSDVVTEEAQSFKARAVVEDRTFTMSVEPMLTLCGDEKAIRKLVSILLDNAMKYSPKGGEVSISLEKKGRQVKLAVSNTAENVTEETLSKMFTRFWRGDASRNSSGGYGIGLSIAQAVVTAHHGKVQAISPDGKSVEITVKLPIGK